MKKRKLIIFTDIGDTIIDESTEVYEGDSTLVLQADCIPGAQETMLFLYEQGYTIVIVADGLVQSFQNSMQYNRLSHIFTSKVISEEVGVCKLAAIMFETAMQRTRLTDADKYRVIMIGNNLERDIVGANRFGIQSVHMAWSNHYRKEPKCNDEIPNYYMENYEALIELVEKLEQKLHQVVKHSG